MSDLGPEVSIEEKTHPVEEVQEILKTIKNLNPAVKYILRDRPKEAARWFTNINSIAYEENGSLFVIETDVENAQETRLKADIHGRSIVVERRQWEEDYEKPTKWEIVAGIGKFSEFGMGSKQKKQIRRAFVGGSKPGSFMFTEDVQSVIRYINAKLTYGLSDQNYPKHGWLKKPIGVVK